MNRNKFYLAAVVVLIIGGGFLLLWGNENAGKSVHNLTHKADICSGENCIISNTTAQLNNRASCSDASCASPASKVAVNDLTPAESKVVDYMVNQTINFGKTRITATEIREATGVSIDDIDPQRLNSAAFAELSRRNFDFEKAFDCGNCSKFSACSVDRNLSNASGEELERYAVEKADDGKTFTKFAAPNFTLPTTAGTEVSVKDFKGKPVVLVFLSMHCYHSFQTLPSLSELHKKYESQGLTLLPVYINTTVEDVKETLIDYNIDFPVAVSENKAISKLYKSRMVPTTFLIDSNGYITKKLVGYKDEPTLDKAFSELVEVDDRKFSLSNF